MNKIILYTTHCPKCKILAKKLDDKKIAYDICDDVKEMQAKGIMSVPVLEIEDNKLNFYDAIKYVNSL